MSRNLLAKHKLPEFKKWLKKDGWEMIAPTNVYEVLRARKPTRGGKFKTIVYYIRNTGPFHLTAPKGLAESLARSFINETKNQGKDSEVKS